MAATIFNRGHKAAPTKTRLFSRVRRQYNPLFPQFRRCDLFVILRQVENAFLHRHIALVADKLTRDAGAVHLPHRETVRQIARRDKHLIGEIAD